LALLSASFTKYESNDVTIINARMVNSQMIRVPHNDGLVASASARNVISATPVTP